MEEWRIVEEHPRYEVSSFGRMRRGDKIHKGYLDAAGYRMVSIRLRGEKLGVRLHRLIAKAFIPNPNDKPFVDHIDRNRTNNHIFNLRWATAEENNSNKNIAANFKVRNINQYSIKGDFIKTWRTAGDIGEYYGWNKQTISNACRQAKSLGNFLWRFADIIPIEGEIWKDVIIDEYTIQASSMGRIKTLAGNLTYGHKQGSGYKAVHIGAITIVVHKVIAMAFYPLSSYKGLYVNHIDSNKHNNKAGNLEWVTPKENNDHSIISKGTAKCMRPVIRYDVNGEIIKNYNTMRDAMIELGITKSSQIINCCEGKYKTVLGTVWKYANNLDNESMPEKIEVEIMSQQLQVVIGSSLIGLDVNSLSRYYTQKLKGRELLSFPLIISSIESRGKKIIIRLSQSNGKDLYMVTSPSMSGRFTFETANHCGVKLQFGRLVAMHRIDGTPVGRNARIIDRTVYFDDKRHFGQIVIYPSQAAMNEALAKKVGPDLLHDDVTEEQWLDKLRKSTRKKMQICKFLMEQKYFSGIGNYLKAEILYKAKIRPDRQLQDLTDDEAVLILEKAKETIQESLDAGGLTIEDYLAPNGESGNYERLIYDKKHDPDGNPVVTDVFKDKRTTHWVPAVQV